MNKLWIAFLILCPFGAHLSAQSSDRTIWAGGRWLYPFYYGTYDPYYDELHTLKNYRAFWGHPDANNSSGPSVTGSPLPAPPPATSVTHEYSWPEQSNTSATFSIVTTNGTEYLASMIWVEDDTVHFSCVDGTNRQLPLASISRPLTQAANAQKNLSLSLPAVEAGKAAPANGETPATDMASKSAAALRSKGN